MKYSTCSLLVRVIYIRQKEPRKELRHHNFTTSDRNLRLYITPTLGNYVEVAVVIKPIELI